MIHDTSIMSLGFTGRIWRRFRASRRGIAGLSVVLILLLGALCAPLLAGRQPIVCRYQDALRFPGVVDLVRGLPLGSLVLAPSKPFSLPGFDTRAALSKSDFAIWPIIPYGPLETSDEGLAGPSTKHWLGTDDIGRDLAARMVHGAVVSVKVGFVSMGIAALIGIVVGGVAGYCGGWIDAAISRVIEVVTCFPDFFLILAVMVWLEPDIINVMVVIGLTRWTTIARFTRAEFLRLKTLDYVAAARAAGAGAGRIMVRHLLPNALAPVLVTVTFGIAQAVLIEAGLSWLGFGVQPPNPSWGNLLQTAFARLDDAPFMVYPPCIAIFVTVLAYNLAGDALRDAIDPKMNVYR